MKQKLPTVAALNEGIVGQVDDTTFVHRLYQESHVRFRLIAKSEGDKLVAHVAEFRFISGTGIADIAFKSEVFGDGFGEYFKAESVYRAWVEQYITKELLP